VEDLKADKGLMKFFASSVGNENLKKRQGQENIMEGPHVLESTSESQGHGKAWEIDIQKRCFRMTDEEISSHKHIEKYDIRKEYNHIKPNRNVSIKTSSGMIIDCGDIIRFLTSEDMDIICVIFNQEGNIKTATKTIVFQFEDFIKILKRDVEEYCGLSYEEWFEEVNEYDTYIKGLPEDYYPSSKLIPKKEREHLNKKAPLCIKIKYFNIAPKIDGDQQRVQGTINLNKLKELTMNNFEGGHLYDSEYTKKVRSGPRNRHS